MIVEVIAKAGAKQASVEALGGNRYSVRVRERAVDGKANAAIAAALADHFGVAKTDVVLKRGQTAKVKIFEITA